LSIATAGAAGAAGAALGAGVCAQADNENTAAATAANLVNFMETSEETGMHLAVIAFVRGAMRW
jgi:hypothetical protein